MSVHLYIYEDSPEALARHLLLLTILLDDTAHDSVKMQRFLEIFGNHFLREDTLEYLKMKCRDIEQLLADKIAQTNSRHQSIVASLVDVSMMRYEAKDAVLSAIVQIRSSSKLDMKSAWDLRCRKWYGERYDFRRNMVRRMANFSLLLIRWQMVHIKSMTGPLFHLRMSPVFVGRLGLPHEAIGREISTLCAVNHPLCAFSALAHDWACL